MSKVKITCWGDSITEGMCMPAEKTYPSQLALLLGDGYTVLNGGDGGENSFAIGSRQGAFDLYTSQDITFQKGVDSVDIGTDGDGLYFASKDGAQKLKLRGWLGHDMPINPITIDGAEYKIGFKNGTYDWSHRNNPYILTRMGNTDSEVTITVGTPVYLSGKERSDIQIYYAGCNNQAPYNSSEAIISDLKAMIKNHGSDKYLVIVPHWTDEHDAAFDKEFGSHAVHLRKESIKNGLAYESLTKSADDEELMAKGLMPASLRFKADKTEVHLNLEGYHFLAHLVYERGRDVGLW